MRGAIDALVDLSGRVALAAKPYAPELDAKPLSPHVTLARVSPGSKEVGRLLTAYPIDVQPVEFSINTFALYHSAPDGAYTVLREFALARS